MSRPLDYSEAYYNYKEKQANLRESDGCNGIADRQKIKNFKKDMPGIDIGDFGEIDDLYFKKIESKSDDKNEKK